MAHPALVQRRLGDGDGSVGSRHLVVSASRTSALSSRRWSTARWPRSGCPGARRRGSLGVVDAGDHPLTPKVSRATRAEMMFELSPETPQRRRRRAESPRAATLPGRSPSPARARRRTPSTTVEGGRIAIDDRYVMPIRTARRPARRPPAAPHHHYPHLKSSRYVVRRPARTGAEKWLTDARGQRPYGNATAKALWA